MSKKSIRKAASGVRTSACSRFRVWLHFTSQGDCLQTVHTLDMERRLPLVAICAAWRADQVLCGSCTFSLLASKRDREIQRSTVALLSFVCCCECFSNPYTQIRKTKARLEKWFRTSPTRHKMRKGLHIGLI